MTALLPRPRAARAWALVGAALMALLVVAGPVSAAPSTTGSRSLSDLGACMSATHHADVLLLIDQSRSLQSTDPRAARVGAAQLLIARLADTAQRTGSSIDLSISGFDSSVQKAMDWAPLNADTAARASTIVGNFADKQNGFETDYWTALTTAHAQLVAHRSAGTAQHCQALVLFTDGQYDLTPRDTAAERQQYGTTKPIPGVQTVPITSQQAANRVEEAGKAELCRSGGVADGLRSDNIMLIALGLNAGGNEDLGLLNGIAESQPTPCGSQPPFGLFLSATDVNDLVLAFDAVGDPSNPPQPVDQRGVCEVTVCAEQTHTFDLDGSIQSIHLLGTSSAKGIDVYVRPPDAGTVKLSYSGAHPAGQIPVGALVLHYNWYADGAFAIDVQAPPDGSNWSGTWNVVFVDPTGQHPDAVSKTQLTIQADLGAVAHDATKLGWRSGEKVGPVTFDLVRSNGQPAVIGSPAPTLALDVSLRAANGKEVTLASAVPQAQFQAGIPLTVPEGFPSGPAELRTSLAVTTLSNLKLQPQVHSQPLTIAPALGFPSVAQRSIDFGTVDGTTATTTTMRVTGPGCIWVDKGVQLQAQPAGFTTRDVTVGGPSSSQCLQAKGPGTVTLTLRSAVSTQGQLSGTVPVHLSPIGHLDRATTVDVPFRASLERQANTGVLWLAFVAALVVGIGLPVLVFLFGRRIAARLPAAPLQSALLDVRVGPEALRSAASGPLVAPERWDMVPPPDSGRRRARLSQVPVRAKAGVRITEAGYAEVVDDGRVGVSGPPGGRSRSLRARLPLALQGSWTLLLDPVAAASDDAEIPGQLLIVADAAATPQQRDELLARARQEAPGAAESLRQVARAQRPDAGRTASPVGGPPAPEDPLRTGDSFSGVPGPRTDPFARTNPSGGGDPFADPFGRATVTPPTSPPPATPPAGAPADDPFRRHS